MHKVEPVFLVAVHKLIVVLPVRFHNLFVVVLDESLEHTRLIFLAGIDFCEQAVNQQPIDDNSRFLAPNLGS